MYYHSAAYGEQRTINIFSGYRQKMSLHKKREEILVNYPNVENNLLDIIMLLKSYKMSKLNSKVEYIIDI